MGTLALTTERVSSEGYAILPPATASSGGDGEGGGGDQGGDQIGEGEGGFQPDSDSDETETADETETDEETEPEPTPELDGITVLGPSPQGLVEICDNGQDDDNDGYFAFVLF